MGTSSGRAPKLKERISNHKSEEASNGCLNYEKRSALLLCERTDLIFADPITNRVLHITSLIVFGSVTTDYLYPPRSRQTLQSPEATVAHLQSHHAQGPRLRQRDPYTVVVLARDEGRT
jgi:hypothetical protein